MTTNLFEGAEVVYAFTRKQALQDGFQVDGNIGDFAEVTKQHFKFPVYMTSEVFGIIERAVENKRHCNDIKGVWHDILWMLKMAARHSNGQIIHFKVIITGAGKNKYWTFKAECGPMDIDDPRPSITIMLPEQD